MARHYALAFALLAALLVASQCTLAREAHTASTTAHQQQLQQSETQSTLHAQSQSQSQSKEKAKQKAQSGTEEKACQSPDGGGCNPPLAPNMVDSVGFADKSALEQAIAKKQEEINALRSEMEDPKYKDIPPPPMAWVDAIRPVDDWIDNFHKRVEVDWNDPEEIAQPTVDRLKRKHERLWEELQMLNEKMLRNVREVMGQAIAKVIAPRAYDTYGVPHPGLLENVGIKDNVHNEFATANVGHNINKTNKGGPKGASSGSGSGSGSESGSGSGSEESGSGSEESGSGSEESGSEESSGQESEESGSGSEESSGQESEES